MLGSLEVQISNDDFLRTRPMRCLAEGAADAACSSRYDDGFAGNLHGLSRDGRLFHQTTSSV
jgi:hypothetical protein